MIKFIKENLSKHMSTAQLDAILGLWNVDNMGKVNKWVTDDRLNLETSCNDPILLQLRVLIDKQNGVDNHMYMVSQLRHGEASWKTPWE